MHFSVTIFGSLLLGSAVVAFPSGFGHHIARRREGHQSQVSNRLTQNSSTVYDTVYTSNWAGAVWAEGDGTFTYVTGTFTAPTPSGSVGDTAAAWVGIDGDTCTSAILQTGITFTVESGEPQYIAWYEWYPALSYYFSGITISAGDVIKLTVQATSTASGTASIENLTNGQTVSENITSSAPLCGQNAEWIVEDYTEGDSIVPFANFGTVTFTNAEATGSGTYTPSGATIFDIGQNDNVLTSVSTSGSSVTINYV